MPRLAASRALWWPPAKLAARHLGAYLAEGVSSPGEWHDRTTIAGAEHDDTAEPERYELAVTMATEVRRSDAARLALLLADQDAEHGDLELALQSLAVSRGGPRRSWTTRTSTPYALAARLAGQPALGAPAAPGGNHRWHTIATREVRAELTRCSGRLGERALVAYGGYRGADGGPVAGARAHLEPPPEQRHPLGHPGEAEALVLGLAGSNPGPSSRHLEVDRPVLLAQDDPDVPGRVLDAFVSASCASR